MISYLILPHPKRKMIMLLIFGIFGFKTNVWKYDYYNEKAITKKKYKIKKIKHSLGDFILVDKVFRMQIP